MEITRRTDYAIRMLISLAREPEGQPVSAGELGRRQDVPHALARGIVSQLARAGFVASRRGAGGGVVLARPAGEIDVLSVVEAIEGRIGLGLCTNDPGYCHRVDACVMHRVWAEAEQRLRSFLGTRTIADLSAPAEEVTPVR